MHLLALLTDSHVRLSSRLRTIGRYGFCNMPSITPYLATPSDSPQTVSVPEQWGVTHKSVTCGMWHASCTSFLFFSLACLASSPYPNFPYSRISPETRGMFHHLSSLLLPLSKIRETKACSFSRFGNHLFSHLEKSKANKRARGGRKLSRSAWLFTENAPTSLPFRAQHTTTTTTVSS